jgi:hypothetical protein
MADTATVLVDDPDTIEVDVTDLPEVAAKVETKPAATQVTQRTSATDTAAADLQAAIKAADDAKRALGAAEQTAATERRAREAAEQRARDRDAENQRYRQAAEDNEIAVINSGIEAAKSAQDSAQQEFQRAMEAGEFDKAAAAQKALATASAQVVQLEGDKAVAERAAKTKPAGGAVDRTTDTATLPVFEQYVSGFSPRTQAWLRLHPDCIPPNVGGRPDRFNATMAAHYEALGKGLSVDTDEYFKLIEAKLNPEAAVATTTNTAASKAAETTAAVVDSRPAPRQRQAAPAAPVSRDAPVPPGQRTTRSVTLTKEQQEAARFSFPHLTPQEALAAYARNLVELDAEGKMGRLTH